MQLLVTSPCVKCDELLRLSSSDTTLLRKMTYYGSPYHGSTVHPGMVNPNLCKADGFVECPVIVPGLDKRLVICPLWTEL